jgi:predicted RNA-binding Zn-ribbon protein involved in translation (DUF1610 family)
MPAGAARPGYNPRNFMSDRKYRQRGYQDSDRDRERPAAPATRRPPPEPGAPAGARRLSQDAPKNINMPGFREVVRCATCGNPVTGDIGADSRCPRCGNDLHACAQCTSFDPGSRFECMQPIPARITPKNARNSCTSFSPRTTIERETTAPRPDSARKAFDDLFKF